MVSCKRSLRAGDTLYTRNIFCHKSICSYLQYVKYCQVLSISVCAAGLQGKGSEWRLSLWPMQLPWINSPHKGLDFQAGLENNADISADWQHNRAKCFNASMLPLDWVYNDKWLMQKFMVLKTHFPAKCHPIYTAKQQLKLWLLTSGYVQNGTLAFYL